jgi:hypothetical protein
MALRVSSATPLLGSALGALGIGAASAAAGQVLLPPTSGCKASAHHGTAGTAATNTCHTMPTGNVT